MERIRENAIENGQVFSRELENLNRQSMEVIGDKFAKDHYPEINDNVLKDLLNKKSFYIERACPINESVYNSRLRDEIAEAYRGIKGLYLLLRKALYG
jgi:hypothetical protein